MSRFWSLFPRGRLRAVVTSSALFGALALTLGPPSAPVVATTTGPAPGPRCAGAEPSPVSSDPASPPADPRPAEPPFSEQLWHHPVDAPVVDGFRPPATPYGPGNRGLEYGTTGGEAVSAAADGLVTFAGAVGRSRFVVIQHPSGLRSTYAHVRRIDVEVKTSVARGEPIATAEPGFHLTARRGSTYLDPLLLMAEGCFVVRLVPVPSPDRLSLIDG